ncbi:hypothetical protein K469DRAFT_695762 [Zopfia rhizophila CBS 207.26]|uniref:BTB domain-containing protein n=1 Tax=Zopfia rhizophila CBS 207.26 TaxID=1314779 RepID=A0A6A6DKM2_9PEZI|nr:hypothetical protein K469DRAFT_695762 [Zopfia rhizophila CBS 207.26]
MTKHQTQLRGGEAATASEDGGALAMKGTKRPRPRMSGAAADSIIMINVANKKSFQIHKSLLTYRSEYFRGALEGSFKESQDRKLDLPDVSVETFEIFVDWLYSKKLHVHKPDSESPAEKQLLVHQLVETYIFADAHDIPDLQRKAMDTIFRYVLTDDHGQENPSYETVAYAFPRLPEGSPLRQFFIDVECRWGYKAEDDEGSNMSQEEDEEFEDSGSEDDSNSSDEGEDEGEESSRRKEKLVPSKAVEKMPPMVHVQWIKARSDLPRDFLVGVMIRHAMVTGQIRNGKLQLDYDLNICDYHKHTEREERHGCSRESKKRNRTS